MKSGPLRRRTSRGHKAEDSLDRLLAATEKVMQWEFQRDTGMATSLRLLTVGRLPHANNDGPLGSTRFSLRATNTE
jgi:hypothetical protein